MTARDAAAASPFDDASLWQTTGTAPIELPQPAAPKPTSSLSQAERAARRADPLPVSGNERGTLAVLLKTDLETSDETSAARIRERFRQIETRGDAIDYAREVMTKVQAWRIAHPKSVARPTAGAAPLRRAH